MKWVYILQCYGDYYYVGETERLYRRFWEHLDGIGGLNTSTYKPETITAIYKVNTICKFLDYNEYVNKIRDGIWPENYKGFKLRDFNDECEDYKYDNLSAENNIAECLMIYRKDNWNKIRGGKYTRFDIKYKYPDNNYIKDLPICKCGFPCDIKKNEEKNYIYFRCAKKNMWDEFRDVFHIVDEPCTFFMEYTKDTQFKLEEKIKWQERVEVLKKLFKISPWLGNVERNDENYPQQCVGGCNKTNNSKKLSYSNEKRNLCFDCFIEKNEELSKIYSLFGKCLIKS
jgi:predicted GIY-YIG superfamily endonuclease